MNRKLIFLISLISVFILIFGHYYFVFAQQKSGGSKKITLPNPLGGECNKLDCVISKIISKLAELAIPVVVIMVLIGGFQILTAAGNEEKIRSGKATLWWAVIGYVIILLANGLVLIIQSILKE